MSKKCKAYSESKLGLEPPDNRKAFYAGWDAALAEQQSGIKQVIELYDSPEQPEQQGCMRCNTPKKCALYGCSPLTWPAEQPAQEQELDELTAQQEPVTSLQCAHCQVTIDSLNEKVVYLMNKQWVELTEEEIDALDRQCYGFHQPVAWRGPFARAIEAKLKEKNRG